MVRRKTNTVHKRHTTVVTPTGIEGRIYKGRRKYKIEVYGLLHEAVTLLNAMDYKVFRLIGHRVRNGETNIQDMVTQTQKAGHLDRLRLLAQELEKKCVPYGKGNKIVNDVSTPKSAPKATRKLMIAAMYHLAGWSFEDAERDMGWPKRTLHDLKSKHPSIFRYNLNKLCDRCFDLFQKDRVAIISRVMNACPTAIEIVDCAMRGKPWNKETVTKEQRVAAENMIKRFHEFTAKDPGWKGSSEDATSKSKAVDEDTAALESYIDESGLEEKGTN